MRPNARRSIEPVVALRAGRKRCSMRCPLTLTRTLTRKRRCGGGQSKLGLEASSDCGERVVQHSSIRTAASDPGAPAPQATLWGDGGLGPHHRSQSVARAANVHQQRASISAQALLAVFARTMVWLACVRLTCARFACVRPACVRLACTMVRRACVRLAFCVALPRVKRAVAAPPRLTHRHRRRPAARRRSRCRRLRNAS